MLIDFDDKLVENPTIASVCGVDTAQFLEKSSQKEQDESGVDTLISM